MFSCSHWGERSINFSSNLMRILEMERYTKYCQLAIFFFFFFSDRVRRRRHPSQLSGSQIAQYGIVCSIEFIHNTKSKFPPKQIVIILKPGTLTQYGFVLLSTCSYTNKLKVCEKIRATDYVMLEWTHPKSKMVTSQSSQGQCHNFKILMHEICCHFGTLWNATWFWIAFGCSVTFETYFTVDCTQLLVKKQTPEFQLSWWFF